MRKKVCAIILAGCLALGMAGNTTVYAAGNLTESVEERGDEENGFEYEVSWDGATITGYTGEPVIGIGGGQ